MVSHLRRAVVLALATVLLTAGVAFAGGGATVTHFAVLYPDLFTGVLVDCTGNRIVQSDPNAFVKDAETCMTVSDSLLVGSYTIVPFTGDNFEDFLWASDYEALTVTKPFTNPPCVQPLSNKYKECFRTAVSGNVTVTSSDGLYTWSIVAYYAPY